MATVAFDLRHPDLAAHEVREANQQLARQPEVPSAISDLIDAVADELVTFDAEQFEDDPYLLVAIQRAELQAKRALDHDDERQRRRAARIALDDLERLLVALAERQPVSAERDANQVARWLVEDVGLPARQLAPVIGVHERTLQRWAAQPPASTPSGEEERMLRSIAQVVAQLRHSLTAHGALAWLAQPNASLDAQAPVETLRDPAALPTVLSAARALRAMPFA